MFWKVWSSRTARWMIKGLLQPSFDDKGGWLNWYKCWMGGESWYAIKKLFNSPFLILKVRHPAVTGVYWDSRSVCSNDYESYGSGELPVKGLPCTHYVIGT